jgi:hypothetical protein
LSPKTGFRPIFHTNTPTLTTHNLGPSALGKLKLGVHRYYR